MTSPVDATLQAVGEPITIIRTGGNVSTHFYMSPKGIAVGRKPYERDVMMPTVSGVLCGDLILHRNENYLVVYVFEDRRVGEFFYYKVGLYKCNLIVSVKKYNAGTKAFADTQTGVKCLIVGDSASTPSDRGIAIPTRMGRDDVYYVYAQASAGIDKNSILVDANSNHFRVMEGINLFFADGLVEAPVKLEVQ